MKSQRITQPQALRAITLSQHGAKGMRIEDNRREAIAQAKMLAEIQNRELGGMGVMQKATSMSYKPQNLTVDGVSCPVGHEMTAKLDAEDIVVGSEAKNDTNQNDLMEKIYQWDGGQYNGTRYLSSRSASRYVKGHLLNHDLGGPGWALNLFPITHQANMRHCAEVELPVKSILANEGQVVYSVTVNNVRIENNLPTAEFYCEIKRSSGETKQITIESIPGKRISHVCVIPLLKKPPLAKWHHKTESFDRINSLLHMTVNDNEAIDSNIDAWKHDHLIQCKWNLNGENKFWWTPEDKYIYHDCQFDWQAEFDGRIFHYLHDGYEFDLTDIYSTSIDYEIWEVRESEGQTLFTRDNEYEDEYEDDELLRPFSLLEGRDFLNTPHLDKETALALQVNPIEPANLSIDQRRVMLLKDLDFLSRTHTKWP